MGLSKGYFVLNFFLLLFNNTKVHCIYKPGFLTAKKNNILFKCFGLVSVSGLFLPQLYGAATPKWFKIALPVIKYPMSW